MKEMIAECRGQKSTDKSCAGAFRPSTASNQKLKSAGQAGAGKFVHLSFDPTEKTLVAAAKRHRWPDPTHKVGFLGVKTKFASLSPS